MYLPSVQPVNQQDIYISGDVEIDPQAILAPGVILQATDDSRIIIKAGACIGMGTVINAYQGAVIIGSGAVLGAGVLIIGNCQIGSNACIGTASTILDTSVESNTLIPPGSLLGDQSRQFIDAELLDSESLETKEIDSEKKPDLPEETDSAPKTENPEPTQPEASPNQDSPVIGEVYINQLLLSLFPDRKNFRNTKENE